MSAKRKPLVKPERRRRPVTFQTLQMMVMSGVVRRADFSPPPLPHRTGYSMPDDTHGAFPQECASEQGWLSRMILGRKQQAPATNRS